MSAWTEPSEAVPCDGTRVFAETSDGALVFCIYRDDEWQSADGVHAFSVARWMSETDLRAALSTGSQA